MTYETKDSGERAEYDSGMVRDTQEGKARFDLMRPKGVPYDNQFMTRVAQLMTRGAVKYGFRNWEHANSQEELERFQGSAERHLAQYLAGVNDGEDHAAAVVFNLIAAETTRYKIEQAGKGYTIEQPLTFGDLQVGVVTTTSIQPGTVLLGPAHPEYTDTNKDGYFDEGQPARDYAVGTRIRRLGFPGSGTAIVVKEPDENGIGHATYTRPNGPTVRFDIADWVVVSGT